MLSIKGKKYYAPNECPYKAGYVYVIINGNGLYKIGKSLNPEQRLKSLTLGDKGKILIKNHYKYQNYNEIEKELHVIFNSKKISGEWFELNEQDLEFIKKYKKIP